MGNPRVNKYVLAEALEFTFSIPVVSGDINFLVHHPNTEIISVYGNPEANYKINDETNCVECKFNNRVGNNPITISFIIFL